MADETRYEQSGQFQDIEGLEYATGMPFPQPLPLPRVSGLYEWHHRLQTLPVPQRAPRFSPEAPVSREVEGEAAAGEEIGGIFPWLFKREELRLDVDGLYPQMTASGTSVRGMAVRVHWVAKLRHTAANQWSGSIWYKEGAESTFPYTSLRIDAARQWFPNQRKATVTFHGPGVPDRVLTYSFRSSYFRHVELEYDRTADSEPVTLINPCEHANHPSTLTCGNLSIEDVFRRSGFRVTKSGGDGEVPEALSDGGTWSDSEMHDAMQSYWSRFANVAQWSMWTFFADLHEMGTSLGGIMFDDVGPNHRQGTAIFTHSFIATAPGGDSQPEAWVRRMRFWTAVHEMGHAFNLAHSWQKSLGAPWIPLADEPDARSFMNYPYRVAGGQSGFFSDFDYRFSDMELLFMRHAPERFVKMGAADWFDHHGFRQANTSPEPAFRLDLRVNRQRPVFDFMEPAVLELKLTNISGQAQLLDEDILSNKDNMTIIIKKEGETARQFIPYARYFTHPRRRALNTGDSIYESLFIAVGRNGWDVAEPGRYTVQVALHTEAEDIISNPLHLRIAPPRSFDEEYWAQDFFSDSVGRVLTFDGSRFLQDGNDTLREVSERFSDRPVATHAQVALGNALMNQYKLLKLPERAAPGINSAKRVGGYIEREPAKVQEAWHLLGLALGANPNESAETLSHIDYKYYSDHFSRWLATNGEFDQAGSAQDRLYQTLAHRGVKQSVLHEISQHRSEYAQRRIA